MPFLLTPFTDTTLSTLRGETYASAQYISLCPNEIIFDARVNQSTFGVSYTTVQYDTVSVGSYLDLKVGQTVLISSTDDYRNAEFVGRIRNGNSTATYIEIDETSVGIADNYRIVVLDDYRIQMRLARDVNGTQYKDYDYAFFGFAPVISGLQSGYADWVGEGNLRYRISFSPSVLLPLVGTSVGSYAWSIDDCTLISGTLASKDITIDAPPGFRWITFRCTDNGGRYTDFRIPVWAHHPTLYPPALGFTGASISCDERGYNASVGAFEGVQDVLDNTLCVIWGKEYYNGVQGSLNGAVQFVGRIQQETIKTEGSADYATLPQDTRWELEGIGSQLARTALGAILTMHNTTVAATAWDYIQTLTLWRAIVYVLQLHSTFNTVVSLAFEDTTDTFITDALTTQGTSLLEVVNDIAFSINGGMDFAPSGETLVSRDARMLPFSQRASTVLLALFGIADALSFSVEHPHTQPIGRVNAGGGTYDSNIDFVTPYLSIAPGEAQARGQGETTLQRQVLEANISQQEAQEEINERAGHYFALVNGRYVMNFDLPDGYHWLIPQRNVWYEWDIPLDSNNRNIRFPSGVTFMLLRLSHTHNNETGSKSVQATFSIETSGVPGLSYIPAATGQVAPAVPYVPPNPTYTLTPEQPGSIYPSPAIATLPPVQLPSPPGTYGGSSTVLRDGNGVLIASTSRAWVAKNFKATSSPRYQEVTPVLESGYLIRAAAWSKFDQRLYILTSNPTSVQSVVYAAENGFASAPTWVASATINGDYRALKTAEINGGVLIYTPDEGGGGGSWCETFDFTLNDGGWVIAGGAVYASGAWRSVDMGITNLLSIERAFTSSAVTTVQVTYTTVAAANLGSRGVYGITGTPLYGALNAGIGTFTTTVNVNATVAGIQVNVDTNTVATNASEITSITICGTGTNPFSGGGAGQAAVRYSNDYAASFLSGLNVGTALTGFGGFDVNKVSAGSLAGRSGQVELATTSGGAYAPYGGAFPAGANPNALWIPRYAFGSTSSNNSTATPEYLAASSSLTAGNAGLWKVTASGVTFTDITPTQAGNFGVAISGQCISMAHKSGSRIATILGYGGTRRLKVSSNAGGAWTDRGALTANADYPRFRDSDTTLNELYWVDTVPYFSADFGATPVARTRPSSDNIILVEVFG